MLSADLYNPTKRPVLRIRKRILIWLTDPGDEVPATARVFTFRLLLLRLFHTILWVWLCPSVAYQNAIELINQHARCYLVRTALEWQDIIKATAYLCFIVPLHSSRTCNAYSSTKCKLQACRVHYHCKHIFTSQKLQRSWSPRPGCKIHTCVNERGRSIFCAKWDWLYVAFRIHHITVCLNIFPWRKIGYCYHRPNSCLHLITMSPNLMFTSSIPFLSLPTPKIDSAMRIFMNLWILSRRTR